MRANSVRIIGGYWRSRILRFPDTPGLRPTPDRVRETVFNWLGQDLSGKRCLDLFSGSGVLGFEAASRGAHQVVMVERDRRAAQILQTNAHLLGATPAAAAPVEVVHADALEFLGRERRDYDVMFVDPPYALWQTSGAALGDLLPRIRPRLASAAVVYLEAAAFPPLPEGWQTLKQDRAGAVHYQLIEAVEQ